MKVKLKVSFEIEAECPDDWDAGMIRFHFEENHCIQNLILQKAEEIEANDDFCIVCDKGEVKVL